MSVKSDWSTKSLPINLGLRWEARPVVESLKDLKIQKIGSIFQSTDMELVIESCHDTSMCIGYDSVICLEDRTPLGRVDDIMGSIKKPFYFVRLTVDRATALEDQLKLGQEVY